MAASLKFLPGSTIQWRGRRYNIVDYAGLDAIIGREPGKRGVERIPVNEAKPHRQQQTGSGWMPPDLVSVPEEEWQSAASRDLRQADVDLGIARNLRVVTNAADPFDSPKKIVLRKVVDCVNGFAHWPMITNSVRFPPASFQRLK